MLSISSVSKKKGKELEIGRRNKKLNKEVMVQM